MRWHARCYKNVPKTLNHRKFTENPVLIQFVPEFGSGFPRSSTLVWKLNSSQLLIYSKSKLVQNSKISLNLELCHVSHLAWFKSLLIFPEVQDAPNYSKISQILYKISINIHVEFSEVLSSILPKLRGTKNCQSSDWKGSSWWLGCVCSGICSICNISLALIISIETYKEV